MASNQMAKSAFLGANWLLYSLCMIFFFTRIYIRWMCFRRLFTEDYLMVCAATILTGIEVTSQLFTDDIYNLMAWVNQTYDPSEPLAFLANTESMLKACGSAIILFLVGFYFVKINFLLFFYRMGNRLLRIYRIVWWIVFAIVLSCGIISVCIGVTTFKCLFDGILYTFTTCETPSYEQVYFTYFRVTVALDIFTDALIIGFPVWLLWGVRIDLRRKIALGGIFSLVGFTIVATILRGALLTEVFASTATGQTFNIPWVWFWFHIEFCIAFLVACLVSFRALFTQHDQQAGAAGIRRPGMRQKKPTPHKENKPARPYPSADGSTTVLGSSGNGSRGNSGFFQKKRFREFQDSILDTCRTLEGLDGDDDDSGYGRSPGAVELYRRSLPDVAAEQGHIGGLRDVVTGGSGMVIGSGASLGAYSPHSPQDTYSQYSHHSGHPAHSQHDAYSPHSHHSALSPHSPYDAYSHHSHQSAAVSPHSPHDAYSPLDELRRDVDRDSQGVSVLEEGRGSAGMPQRRGSSATSQLSLDSLYIQEA